jgi:ABC-type transport system involved in multi-copper enzyme maturation permease subunit
LAISPPEAAVAETDDTPTLPRQVAAATRLALHRTLRSSHLWVALAFAGLPLLLMAAQAAFMMVVSGFSFSDPLLAEGVAGPTGVTLGEGARAASTKDIFQTILIGAYLHFAVFFSATLFGNSALRQEIDDQTLHYLYLQPVRRWVVVLGKYLGFLLMAVPIFCGAVILGQLLILLPYGVDGLRNVLFTASRLTGLLRECLVVATALALFSAVFMAVGSVLKNLFVVFIFYGWEQLSSLLPTTLKNYSLTYYFKHMMPNQAGGRGAAFEILAEPPGTLQTVLVLGLVFVVAMAVSFWQSNRQECLYA